MVHLFGFCYTKVNILICKLYCNQLNILHVSATYCGHHQGGIL